jgi:hypothetical protein
MIVRGALSTLCHTYVFVVLSLVTAFATSPLQNASTNNKSSGFLTPTIQSGKSREIARLGCLGDTVGAVRRRASKRPGTNNDFTT